jgi:hypothetical protein
MNHSQRSTGGHLQGGRHIGASAHETDTPVECHYRPPNRPSTAEATTVSQHGPGSAEMSSAELS